MNDFHFTARQMHEFRRREAAGETAEKICRDIYARYQKYREERISEVTKKILEDIKVITERLNNIGVEVTGINLTEPAQQQTARLKVILEKLSQENLALCSQVTLQKQELTKLNQCSEEFKSNLQSLQKVARRPAEDPYGLTAFVYESGQRGCSLKIQTNKGLNS